MILPWKDGGDDGEGGTSVGGWETMRWVFVFLWQNQKEIKHKGSLLTGQESESVRWYLCGGEVSGVGGHVWKQIKIWP